MLRCFWFFCFFQVFNLAFSGANADPLQPLEQEPVQGLVLGNAPPQPFTVVSEQIDQQSSLAKQQFDTISELTFQIKTSVSQDAAKASYGTGFVIDQRGLLATNFHVIASSLSNPKDYKTYMVDGKKSILATVVAFDSANDLAILKVDRQFVDRVTISQRLPQVGEKLFSLGVPEDLSESVIEGIFNGLLVEGPYSKLLVSSPLNSGMSGGPTVDSRGELVGVNVSIYRSSQNISFSVPANKLLALYKKVPTDLDLKDFTLDVKKVMEETLHRVSSHLTKDYQKSALGPRLTLGSWSTKGLDSSVKCWRSVSEKNQELWEFASQKCRVQESTLLHGEHYGGRYTLDYFTFKKNKTASTLKFFHWVNVMTNGYVHESTWVKDYYTKYKCEPLQLASSTMAAVKVKLCIAKYIRFDDVFDGFFQLVSSSGQDEVLVVRGSAVGFRLDEIKQILLTEVKGIAYQNVSDHSKRSKQKTTVH